MASFGLMLMLVIPFFRRFFDSLRHMGIIFAALGIAALAGVLLLSAATNGAQITYTLAGFTFQPSEFVKILYILMLAGLLSGEVTKQRAFLVTILAIIHVGILVLSRDLGSALIFFAVYLLMMFLATGRWTVLFGGVGLGAAGAVICYFLFAHVQTRVAIWRDPFAVIDSMGYQIAQALFAISYGGLWGAGLTQGAPNRIPFVESDFIFAAIAEEMGLVFAVCLLLLCINCFLRILLLSAGYSNRFFQLFTFGAAVCYIFQTFLTVGGETKFIPLTGVTLPLVSYGGSSVLSTLIMFGLIEMIFILHDERTVRFKQRYEQELMNSYSGAPGAGGGMRGSYAGPSGSPGANGGMQGGYGNRYMQNPNYPPFYNSDHLQQGVYNRGNMYAARSAPPSQQASLKALTIISVVFILVAVLMFALMIIITTSMKNKYARCTAEVDGIVIENILETHTDNDGTSRSYYPVFKYEYEGRTYTERSNSGRYPAKYQVGDNVTVHVNPDKPSEFYVDKDDFIITLIFSIIGGVFLILGIVFIIIRTKTKHRQQMALQ